MFKTQVNTCTKASSPAGLIFVIMLCALNCSYACFAHATRIYKSIDADGNITYSSVPPTDAKHIEKMHVPSNFDVGAESKDSTKLDSIKAAAEQLEADRKQREQEREEARKKLAEQETKKPTEVPPEREIHYYPVYPPYYYPYPGRPRPPRYQNVCQYDMERCSSHGQSPDRSIHIRGHRNRRHYRRTLPVKRGSL